MNSCLFCGQALSMPLSIAFILSFKKISQPLICQTCLNKFNPICFEQACTGCSRPQNKKSLCSDCQQWQQNYPALTLKHTALFTYNEMAKEYMKEFKFQGDLVLAELFTQELSEKLEGYQRTHHIVPIPISKDSLETRGFSQVQLLLEKAGIPYKDWLRHTGTGPRQSTKNRRDRLLSEQFLAVRLENSGVQEINKSILIVDDVYTTGRTIMHAKNAFHQLDHSIEIESISLFR